MNASGKKVKASQILQHGFNLPIRGIFVGNTGSGKTHTVVQLLRTIYLHAFRAICAYSPTMREDDEWDPIEIDAFQIQDRYTEESCKRIWDAQAAIPKTQRDHIMVFVDDNASALRKVNGNLHYADLLHYASRHKLISKIACVQEYTFVNAMQRLQDNEIFVWGNADRRTVDRLYDLLGWRMPKPDFYEIFKYCTDQDYTPMRVSRIPGGSLAIYRGVDELLIPKTSEYRGLPDVVTQTASARIIRPSPGLYGDVRGGPGSRGRKRRAASDGSGGLQQRGARQGVGGGGEEEEQGDWKSERP